jgi:hypothetical protein
MVRCLIDQLNVCVTRLLSIWSVLFDLGFCAFLKIGINAEFKVLAPVGCDSVQSDSRPQMILRNVLLHLVSHSRNRQQSSSKLEMYTSVYPLLRQNPSDFVRSRFACCLLGIVIRSWRSRQGFPPECRWTSTGLHGVTILFKEFMISTKGDLCTAHLMCNTALIRLREFTIVDTAE